MVPRDLRDQISQKQLLVQKHQNDYQTEVYERISSLIWNVVEPVPLNC